MQTCVISHDSQAVGPGSDNNNTFHLSGKERHGFLRYVRHCNLPHPTAMALICVAIHTQQWHRERNGQAPFPEFRSFDRVMRSRPDFRARQFETPQQEVNNVYWVPTHPVLTARKQT